MQNFIRMANTEDEQLIRAYFEQSYQHYEAAGELLAMQDIKYFLANMKIMRFYVKSESTVQITYVFELPALDGSGVEQGELMIPFQNN